MPTCPDTCFVHSLRGQVPDGVLQKIKRDVRSEFVSLTTTQKVARDNNLCIKIKLERNQKDTIKFKYGDTVVNICKIDQHYFPYIENTYITSYYIKHYEQLKEREDGHLFYKANKRTHDRFLDSYKLVNLLMEQKRKALDGSVC